MMDGASYNAAINGDHNLFRNVDNIRSRGQNNTILHIAAKSGKLRQLNIREDLLLRFLYEQNNKGNTPLHIAAKLGHLEMVRILVEMARKSDVEQNKKLLIMENNEKDTALHEAVRHNHFEVVKLLIEKDQDLVSLVNSAGESPLFMAVDRCFFHVALHILDNYPNSCSYQGRNGMNVLHAAVIRSQTRSSTLTILEVLALIFGKFPLIFFGKPSHLLQVCCKIGCPKTDEDTGSVPPYVKFIKKVMEKRQFLAPEKRQILAPGKADDFGWIPPHYAAHLGKTELVELFLTEYDESLAYARNKEGMSALHISAKKGHVEVIKKLIERCPEICELLDDKNQTALHVAVESGEASVVKVLLESSAFQDLVNEKDSEGNTALHLASTQGHFDILAMLANDSKTDKGATNNDGMTFIDIILSNKELKNIDLWEIVSKFQKEIISVPSLEQKSRRKSKEAENSEKLTHNDGRLQNLEEKEEKLTHNHGRPQKLKEKEETLQEITKHVNNVTILVATIIATVTFTAAFTMPGGYNEKGLAVSLQRREDFKLFLIFDALAFVCSSSVMFVGFLWPLLSAIHMVFCTIFLTLLSLLAMVIAFFLGITLVLPEKSNIINSVYIFLPIFILIVLFCSTPVHTIKVLNKKDVRHGFGFWS